MHDLLFTLYLKCVAFGMGLLLEVLSLGKFGMWRSVGGKNSSIEKSGGSGTPPPEVKRFIQKKHVIRAIFLRKIALCSDKNNRDNRIAGMFVSLRYLKV